MCMQNIRGSELPEISNPMSLKLKMINVHDSQSLMGTGQFPKLIQQSWKVPTLG